MLGLLSFWRISVLPNMPISIPPNSPADSSSVPPSPVRWLRARNSLLLDEPTSALDPEYTAEVLDLTAQLRGEGIEFVIVTHEMGFARRACDATAFLHQGRIVEAGPSEALFAHPQTPELQRFFGQPARVACVNDGVRASQEAAGFLTVGLSPAVSTCSSC